jgi:DnaK suppressor protein
MSISSTSTGSDTSVHARLPEFRALLDEQRRYQIADIVELSSDTLTPQADMEDTSRAGDLHVVSLLIAAARQQLQETEAALARIDAGSYGHCESCAVAIIPERLKLLPAARYCIGCQARNRTRRSS